MQFLVDTHAWLWWDTAPEKLGKRAHAAMSEAESVLSFSAASGWEIATKYASGKLALPNEPRTFVTELMKFAAARELTVSIEHAIRAAALPQHHRDPFDRLLVAQAQVEGLVIITNDENILKYDVKTLWR